MHMWIFFIAADINNQAISTEFLYLPADWHHCKDVPKGAGESQISA